MIPIDLPPGISNPALRALAAAGISSLEQFTKISEVELLKLHGMGPKTIRTIREALAERGLKFAGSDVSILISDRANLRIQRCYPIHAIGPAEDSDLL